jgi:hypothetical protein
MLTGFSSTKSQDVGKASLLLKKLCYKKIYKNFFIINFSLHLLKTKGGASMNNFIIVLILLLSVFATLVSAAEQVPEPSHGISYPKGWQNWGTIAVSHRIDNNTLRVTSYR